MGHPDHRSPYPVILKRLRERSKKPKWKDVPQTYSPSLDCSDHASGLLTSSIAFNRCLDQCKGRWKEQAEDEPDIDHIGVRSWGNSCIFLVKIVVFTSMVVKFTVTDASKYSFLSPNHFNKKFNKKFWDKIQFNKIFNKKILDKIQFKTLLNSKKFNSKFDSKCWNWQDSIQQYIHSIRKRGYRSPLLNWHSFFFGPS